MSDSNAPKFSVRTLLSSQSRSRLLVKGIGFPLIAIALYLWATR
jgi:hypothetical protein